MPPIQRGALLRRTTSFGVGYHYGIVVQVEPEIRVVENQMLYGVREVPLEEFAGGELFRARQVLTAKFTVDEIVARARSRIGEKYAFDGFNCEDLVNWAIYGEVRSLQVGLTKLGMLCLPGGLDILMFMERLKGKKPKSPSK